MLTAAAKVGCLCSGQRRRINRSMHQSTHSIDPAFRQAAPPARGPAGRPFEARARLRANAFCAPAGRLAMAAWRAGRRTFPAPVRKSEPRAPRISGVAAVTPGHGLPQCFAAPAGIASDSYGAVGYVGRPSMHRDLCVVRRSRPQRRWPYLAGRAGLGRAGWRPVSAAARRGGGPGRGRLPAGSAR